MCWDLFVIYLLIVFFLFYLLFLLQCSKTKNTMAQFPEISSTKSKFQVRINLFPIHFSFKWRNVRVIQHIKPNITKSNRLPPMVHIFCNSNLHYKNTFKYIHHTYRYSSDIKNSYMKKQPIRLSVNMIHWEEIKNIGSTPLLEGK